MALWILPRVLPLAGGEVIITAELSNQAAASVAVDGVAAGPIRAQWTSSGCRLRVVLPPMSSGVHAVVVTGAGGATASDAITYAASVNRFYLYAISFSDSVVGIANHRPGSEQSLGNIVQSSSTATKPMGGSTQTFLGFEVPPGAASGGYMAPQSTWCYGTTNGLTYALQGFVTHGLCGLRTIPAGIWKLVAASYRDMGSGYEAGDKVSLYVWRPSTQQIVGRIFDNTTDYNHPSGAAPSTVQSLYVEMTGSEVQGVQDGDVLCFEWSVNADATHKVGLTVRYCGAVEPPQANNAALTDVSSVASYIESPVDLWAAHVPTITFDGVEATNVEKIDGTTYDCDAPAHASGAVDVTITFP